MKLPKILRQPELPACISSNAKWLSGEGAGSWFVIEEKSNHYLITRYSPKGNFECENRFEKEMDFDPKVSYQMDYPSHCSVVTVHQNGRKFRFEVFDLSSEKNN